MASEFDRMAAFLAEAATHGGAPVERVDTHTAAVVMAGDHAWKLRRPVDYGFLDYSTRERRRTAALREIADNERGAPGLYIGLAGIADGDGFRLIPPPAPDDSEPVVLMHRFESRDLFDRMATEGHLDTRLMHETGLAIADMHRSAPETPSASRLPDLALKEATALDRLMPLVGEEVAEVAPLLRRHGRAMETAAAARPARRCHGDLHLRNIVFWRGRPAPFDCIDFNDAFTDIDPLYDLAFLLMDLEHRDLSALGPAVLNAWAERMASEPVPLTAIAYDGLALLPLYKACRAAIRAKVAGLTAESTGAADAIEEARAYLRLAGRYLTEPRIPRLIAVGGLSGTGKSTLTRAMAGETGALVIRSDAIRKGFHGAGEADRLPPEAYTAETSARVYAEMLRRAKRGLRAGMTVILDAAHLREGERDRAEALAEETGAPFTGLWLEAPLDRLAERVGARRGDVSDADARVVRKQAGYDLGAIRWIRLRADGDPERVAEAARRIILTA